MKKWIKWILKKKGFVLQTFVPEHSPCAMLEKFICKYEIDLILDVGANIGQFSRGIRENGYKGKIISYEPLSAAYDSLLENSKNDSLWTIYDKCAIGSYKGFVDINISANSVSSSILSIMKLHVESAPTSAYIATERVRIETLDSVALEAAQEFKNIFIKIDTQGFEWEVLDGAQKIMRLARAIQLEVSLEPLYEGTKLWKDIVARLENEGFSVFALYPAFCSPETGRILQCDILFVKN